MHYLLKKIAVKEEIIPIPILGKKNKKRAKWILGSKDYSS